MTDTERATAENRTPMLEMLGVTKRFPGVIANGGVDFSVEAGEVHTLLGENGAGKSTLMNVLYGIHQPDEGEIRLNGRPVRIGSPAVAINHGIGMIHQHFMLVPTLTVAENVALGLPSSRRPLTDLSRVCERVAHLSAQYNLRVDPSAHVWHLSVGERQRVEIIKALYRDVMLLILDEPTAVLTPQEVDDLFATLRQMCADGRGLVFISHKIHEVLALSDRITVLRGGRTVRTIRPADVTRHDLAVMMIGHEVGLVQSSINEPGDVRLRITGLTVAGDRGTDAVRNLSLDIRAGEIVGIAGVSGNGQRELAECIAGLRPSTRGSICLKGREVAGCTAPEMRTAGLGYVPEERMRDGVIGDFTVAENLILTAHKSRSFSRYGFLRTKTIRAHGAALASAFGVKTPSLSTPARNLSGGNIQKVILARELSAEPEVLLVSQPTQGVDVGATEYIHTRLIQQRGRGTAILIISEDLDEIFSLADRIVVLYEGAIIGEALTRTTTKTAIGLMMAGVPPDRSDSAPVT
jgi:simple sugar transport system ATP-binding protein